MNCIGPHRLLCIQMEQQIPYKFRIGSEFIITAFTVFQLRATGVPETILGVEDGGEEGVKCLCYVYVSICEVIILIRKYTNTFSGPPSVVNILKNKQQFFYCPIHTVLATFNSNWALAA